MTDAALDIRHDTEVCRFATTVDGAKAYLDYEVDDGAMVITHTWVPDEIGGRGIAGMLVEAAFGHARAAGMQVRPVCSYAAGWANRNPQYSQLLG
ncbi:MAG: N-acetyltransferase [Proteobacteria bacterium]|nr:N-acetyltransferase [Pseudomonadota bacterium]